jgi:hypothetical protein
MNPTPNEGRRCRHSGPPERAPIVVALRRRDGRMNGQGRSGVQGGRPHSGAALGQLDCGAGGSFFFGARGGRGSAAVPPPPPRGAPRTTVRRGAGPPNIADCGTTAVKSVRCQGKEAKEGMFAVIIFHNRIVALFTNSIMY